MKSKLNEPSEKQTSQLNKNQDYAWKFPNGKRHQVWNTEGKGTTGNKNLKENF